jgi:predicted phage replisome organizer
MADVKWIKITTDIFDDEKILMIESMPSADSIIVVWLKLLTFAGKQNNDGVFLMSNRIAYTDEMLASIFRRDINTVRMALSTFERFGMVEIVENVITIPNWNKHQSLGAYEKRKERDRLYSRERRAAQKALVQKSADQSADGSSDVAFSEEEREKEIDIDKEDISIKKPTKHKCGEYNNVLLTDDELEKLKDEFPDWEQRIDRLSSYVASTGKSYKSHYATIRNWARKDGEQTKQQAQPKKSSGYDDFMAQLAAMRE